MFMTILNLLACALILMLLPKPIRNTILWACGFLLARSWRAAKAFFGAKPATEESATECVQATATVDSAFEPILEPACMRKARKKGQEFVL